MEGLKITICRCGNGAHACAALMSRQGHEVTVFSPLKEEIRKFRKNYEENKGLDAVIVGEEEKGLTISRITDDPETALKETDLVFVTVPAFAHEAVLGCLKRHVNRSALIAMMPCRGMIELEFDHFWNEVHMIAFQTLPWSCRKEKMGARVNIKGIKEKIQAASYPSGLSNLFFRQLEELLNMRIERVRSALTLTFANIGQIFHPGIMYGLFKEEPFREYGEHEIPLFYQGVTEEGAGILEGLSEEIRQAGEAFQAVMPDIETDRILTPREWILDSYEDVIEDKSSLAAMLRTNQAYKGIQVPVKRTERGTFRVDYSARYITEDVPYSLLVTRTLAKMAGVETPLMDQVIETLGQWSGYPYLENCERAMELSGKSRLPFFFGKREIADLAGTRQIQ